MNKIIFFLLIFFSSLYSDVKFYIGLNGGTFNEKFNKALDNAEIATQVATVKVGYGSINAYAIELSLDYIDNRSKIFSQEDSEKQAFNIELIKAFNLHKTIKPFFKAGFGTGKLTINRSLQDELNYGSFNAGAGTFIQLNDFFDIEIGYTYKYLSYEKIDNIAEQTSYKSHLNTIYSGINLRF